MNEKIEDKVFEKYCEENGIDEVLTEAQVEMIKSTICYTVYDLECSWRELLSPLDRFMIMVLEWISEKFKRKETK